MTIFSLRACKGGESCNECCRKFRVNEFFLVCGNTYRCVEGCTDNIFGGPFFHFEIKFPDKCYLCRRQYYGGEVISANKGDITCWVFKCLEECQSSTLNEEDDEEGDEDYDDDNDDLEDDDSNTSENRENYTAEDWIELQRTKQLQEEMDSSSEESVINDDIPTKINRRRSTIPSNSLYCFICEDLCPPDNFSAKQKREHEKNSDHEMYCLKHTSTSGFGRSYKKPPPRTIQDTESEESTDEGEQGSDHDCIQSNGKCADQSHSDSSSSSSSNVKVSSDKESPVQMPVSTPSRSTIGRSGKRKSTTEVDDLVDSDHEDGRTNGSSGRNSGCVSTPNTRKRLKSNRFKDLNTAVTSTSLKPSHSKDEDVNDLVDSDSDVDVSNSSSSSDRKGTRKPTSPAKKRLKSNRFRDRTGTTLKSESACNESAKMSHDLGEESIDVDRSSGAEKSAAVDVIPKRGIGASMDSDCRYFDDESVSQEHDDDSGSSYLVTTGESAEKDPDGLLTDTAAGPGIPMIIDDSEEHPEQEMSGYTVSSASDRKPTSNEEDLDFGEKECGEGEEGDYVIALSGTLHRLNTPARVSQQTTLPTTPIADTETVEGWGYRSIRLDSSSSSRNILDDLEDSDEEGGNSNKRKKLTKLKKGSSNAIKRRRV